MTACERAVWEDAEGSFYFNSKRSMFRTRTSQKNRQVLEDYRAGAELDGIECRVLVEQRKSTERFQYRITMYYTEISGITNVARELKLTHPWRRHPEKQQRIEDLKKMLAVPKSRVMRKIVEAEAALRELQTS
jgi:hypothetical protein